MSFVTCPSCSMKLHVKDELAGKKVRCPACKQVVVAPALAAAPAGSTSGGPTRPQPEPIQAESHEHGTLPAADRDGTATSPPTAAPPADDPDRELTEFLSKAETPGELGRLGGYRILEVLGRGGMGVVFRVEDPALRRQLALKAMLPALAASTMARERFLREARTAASVEHDHVVVIHQVGEERGVPFLAMPLLRGESLDARLKREKRLPIEEALRIGREAALGLAAAHKKGLVHRDVKPANLWLEEETGRVKVLDFGLARAVQTGEQLTQTGAVIGTPAYMAPEQAAGELVDARTDLFSLGCVLYRTTTGEAPFKGKDAISTLVAVRQDAPAAPHAVHADIPPAVSDFILKLLSKNPADRPASAREAAEKLAALRTDWTAQSGRHLLPDAISEKDETPATLAPVAAPSPRRRPPWRRIAVAAALLVLVVGAVAAAIIIRIKGPDGKEVEIKVPDGSTVVVEKDGKTVAAVGPDAPKSVEAVKPVVLAAGTSPLDKLDPAQIPTPERFDWQPKELVAVLGEHRQRHWGQAQGVAISRDGKRITTCGMDGMIRFWDPTTFREIGSVRGRGEGWWIWSLAFSPDGKRLAYSNGGSVGFYDLTGAEPVREKLVLEAAPNNCIALAFSSDGKRLIGAEESGKLSLWNLANGQTKAAWQRPFGGPPFALSADGRVLAYCISDAPTVTLFDISGAEPKEILSVPQSDRAWSLALSPDGKRLAVGSKGGKVHCWDVSGKMAVPEDVIDFGGEPAVLRFSPDGKRLGIAYTQIRLWNFERKDWIAQTPSYGSMVWDFVFTPDGKAVIEANADSVVHFYDIAGDKLQERNLVERRNMLRPYLTNAFFSADGKLVVAPDGEGLGWWNIDGAAPDRLREMTGILPLALSADRKELLLDGPRWFDVTKPLADLGTEYDAKDLDAQRFALMPDGKTILVGTNHGEILFAERRDGKLVVRSRFRVGDGVIKWVGASPDGRMIATYVDPGSALKIWDVTGDMPALRDTLSGGRGIADARFSPDGRLFAASEGDRTTVWDIQNRPARQRRQWADYYSMGTVFAVSFSPDGRTLASASERGSLALRDVETGETRREWQLPGQINYVAYAPDGRHLLTINGNGTGYILRLAPAGSTPVVDAWIQQVAAMPAEKQAEAAAAKLKELNPGFDGALKPTIEDGAVTGLEVTADDLMDLSPLRSLLRLRILVLNGRGDKSRLPDLSPLRGTTVSDLKIRRLAPVSNLWPLTGVMLKNLECDVKPERDEQILRSIPTLETINGKQAAEFWKEVDGKK